MKIKLRSAWIEFFVEQGYSHAITLKPNDELRFRSVEGLHQLFAKTHMMVDRALLGPRFTKPTRASRRSHAVAIVEGLPASGHLHGAFRIAPEKHEQFERLFADGPTLAERNGLWRKILSGGTCHIEKMKDPEGWYDYIFKDIWNVDDTDRLVFMPPQRGF
ncbi:hypothetical protein WJS89_09225 [Sphingomicrobium sp. XHP0235]|uniref:hypothetical protein n=1 Tax=Sphingomicrobium aquimarinum TaxID=3133971 RepID=UPI0031FF245E